VRLAIRFPACKGCHYDLAAFSPNVMSSPSFSLPLRPVRTIRVFERVCEQIRQQIDAGLLKPGDKLPPERELAREFNVSRPAVREALRALESIGVVSLYKGVTGGAFIRNQDHVARLAQSLTEALDSQMREGMVLLDAYRELLTTVVMLAAQRASATEVEAIEAAIRAAEGSDNTDSGRQVWSAIATASNSPVLALLLDTLGVVTWLVQAPQIQGPMHGVTQTRIRLLDAIRAHNVPVAVKEARIFLDRYANNTASGLFRPFISGK